jgi:glutamate/tyrosine decarboxylase-like PLP-dependent enzyme
MSAQNPISLDPQDWEALRAQAHKMVDNMINHQRDLRTGPVWQPIPQSVRDKFHEPLPHGEGDLAAAHAQFMQDVLPYSIGNAHPGFMGWVQGGGTPVGMLADMLAAGLNANVGGRDQIPIAVEQQVMEWMRDLFGFPKTASGLFVTGASMANLMSVWVARTVALGQAVRQHGIAADGRQLVAYTSSGAHGCIMQALDLAGFGTAALHVIPVNANFEMDLVALQAAITADRAAGLTPFFIAATAGTVDVGAVDDLDGVATIAQREKLWFHVDGAFGALAMLAPELAPRLKGLERADSLAFDFHKWGQVPYDAGFLLVRDGSLHEAAFAAPAAYLRRDTRGMAANSPWPCDFGPDLSRGFRALKAWFTIKVFGADKMGEVIANTCRVARHLHARVIATPQLELLAPVSLNIVCFRYIAADAGVDRDALNTAIIADLQVSGIAAPSATTINGCIAIRAAIVNHRTSTGDIDAMLEALLRFGAHNAQSMKATA